MYLLLAIFCLKHRLESITEHIKTLTNAVDVQFYILTHVFYQVVFQLAAFKSIVSLCVLS